MRVITFNTTDGNSFRFEDEDAHVAYIQYTDPKLEEIYVCGKIEIFIMKRHIASVVIGE